MHSGSSSRWVVRAAAGALALAAACRHAPLPALMPDPGVVARIRHLRINVPAAACPGQSFAATYDAQLDDGSYLPRRLAPELLALSSPDATPLPTGDWTASDDPLASLTAGFPLIARLQSNPGVVDTVVVAPEYSCTPRGFRFEGPPGQPAGPGDAGPAVTVRIGFIRTPFYQTLAVASITVARAPPFYLVADAARVLPADWLRVTSAGGQGGWGVPGAPGRDGAPGVDGCPGTTGGPGQDGGAGGRGGPGGAGGAITIIGPDDWPLFAGLIDARSVGGAGGAGGGGGAGGHGGRGGVHFQAAHAVCVDGAPGVPGRRGEAGPAGSPGAPGPDPRVVPMDPRDVFGPDAPPALLALLRTTARP